MNKRDAKYPELEFSQKDILQATREAVELAKRHSFALTFPLVVQTASVIEDWSEYIDCWGQCNNPPPV